jgi:hypothetical protein
MRANEKETGNEFWRLAQIVDYMAKHLIDLAEGIVLGPKVGDCCRNVVLRIGDKPAERVMGEIGSSSCLVHSDGRAD